MFLALDKNNTVVDAEDAIKGEYYFCPACNTRVVLRKGNIKAVHFAHLGTQDCDSFKHDMSEWHLLWQRQFPQQCREVVLERNGIKHRADVLVHDYVIEFQHSPISMFEFYQRNWFYTQAGKKVIWIFDMVDECESNKMQCYDTRNFRDYYKWTYARSTFQHYLPHKETQVLLFFQTQPADFMTGNVLDEVYLEQVMWAIENEDHSSDFRRFCTRSNGCPTNATELLYYVQHKRL